jgi:hypothetical protein
MKEYDPGSARILRASFGILPNELLVRCPPAQECSRQDAANGTLEACAPDIP